MSDADEDATPRGAALQWWREHAEREEYVVGRGDFPGPAERSYLLANGYVLEVAGGLAWILARPGVDVLPDALYPNYWKVVRIVLDAYAPAVVERSSAMRVLSEQLTPPAVLHVRQAANASKRRIVLGPGLEVSVRPGEVQEDAVETRVVLGSAIRVDGPTRTLLEIPVESLRDDAETVAVWLKSLVVSRPELEEAYAARPRPVVLKRIGLMAREVGNDRLADQVDEVLRGAYRYPLGRGHTDRHGTVVMPSYVVDLRTSNQPWLDRQAAAFARFSDDAERDLQDVEASLPRFPRDVLLAHARAAKAYDAYHSTTIEGYRIRAEEVSAIIRGTAVGGHDPEEVRSRMAVAGYATAFERVLRLVDAADGRVPITEALIQELYVDLFSPSVDAGIVSPEMLRGWRTEPAYLRGHLHVPPGPEKLPRLMRQMEDLVNGVEGHPIVRAVLAHLELVTIHPYSDGNGRLARFLMNVALLGEGLPWATIRNDDRPRYFNALHAAQVEGNVLPFARLVAGYAERAANALADAPGGGSA